MDETTNTETVETIPSSIAPSDPLGPIKHDPLYLSNLEIFVGVVFVGILILMFIYSPQKKK
jgi:hypothetical protein